MASVQLLIIFLGKRPLTRIYICDGVMGLMVVLCLWLIDCRGHLSLKSLYRPCVARSVGDLKLSFYCAFELIDLSRFLHLFSFVLLSCLFSGRLNVHWVMKCANHQVIQHCWGSSVKDGREVQTLIEFKMELKGQGAEDSAMFLLQKHFQKSKIFFFFFSLQVPNVLLHLRYQSRFYFP